MKRWGLIAIIVVFLLIQLAMVLKMEGLKPSPPVVSGVLDASNWDYDRDGIMRMDGTWRFYPNELVDPDRLPTEHNIEMQVPRNWENASIGQEAHGNGTYEAVVLLPPTVQSVIGIKVSNIRMSHRLYANGELVHSNGVPANEPAHHKPNNTPYTVYVPVDQDKLHLVIQVSNYKYYQGGIAQSIWLGLPAQISSYSLISFGVGLVGFMMTASFGLYALSIYLMRSRERMYLNAGLFFLAVSLVVACADEKVLMVLLDWMPFDLAYKLQDVSLGGSLLLLLIFFRTVEPAFLPSKVYRFVIAPQLIYLAAVLALPYEWYIYAKIAVSPFQVAVCLASIIRWGALLLNAKERDRRVEYTLMLATALFVTGSLFFHYLYLEQMLAGRLLSFISYFLFIFTINLFLALCSTNIMKRTEKLSEQLWRANEVKNEFLQRTSHELKTPLHGIRNLADHVNRQASELPEEARRHLGLISETTERLSYIVNDLIDATLLRNMSLQVRMVNVDVSSVVEHVMRVISFQTGSKPVVLSNRVAPGTYAIADEQRLQQILYNLVSNSVKYSAKGVIAASASLQGNNIKLCIADQGIGITAEETELIFQDRYRSDAPGQPPTEGLGLGLFISRELARKMGGALYVESSQIDIGTVMALELPAAASAPLPKKSPEALDSDHTYSPGSGSSNLGRRPSVGSESAAAAQSPALQAGTRQPAAGADGRKSILLVDDDPSNIEVLKLILQDDYALDAAYGAEEALALLERSHYDLMIADLIMPGMSGIELTQQVRRRHSTVALPVIIATAAARDQDMQLAFNAGATDYIAKPFAAGEIHKRVQLLLQLASTMDTALRHERAFLAAQIKPHFLYNALNNIIAICAAQPKRAAELLTLLSRHLRRMFQQEAFSPTVSLKQELELVRAYVEIERLRFEDRLHYATDIDPALPLERIRVASLIIQPLVENAISHGIFNKLGPGSVILRVKRLPDDILIEVEDDGIGMEPELVERLLAGQHANGVGLTNVRKRVAAVPGTRFQLSSSPGRGTLCSLTLPLEQHWEDRI